MRAFIDQLGNPVSVNWPPKRIVSTVPSQTELLHYFDLEDEVVGITLFCIHPKHWHTTKTRIGGTKQLNIDTIVQLNPDLVIANKEENAQLQIEELQRIYPVWVSDISTLGDAKAMIRSIGKLTNRESTADNLINLIQSEFATTRQIPIQRSAVYVIWENPMMIAGTGTFIDEMLRICGFSNAFESKNERYLEITTEQLQEADPDVILLSSEPFPFKELHVTEFQRQLPEAQVELVDGEMFSWYGSHLLKTPAYFTKLRSRIH